MKLDPQGHRQTSLFEQSVSFFIPKHSLTQEAMTQFRRQTLLFFGLFLAILLVDQTLKLLIVHGMESFPALRHFFRLVHNPGFAFGTLSKTHPHLRITLYASLLGPILSSYTLLVLDHLHNPKYRKLGLSLTLFVGGIVGNVIDKLIQGAVIDFIPLRIWGDKMVIFNMADVFQIIGAIGIIWFLMAEGNVYSVIKELRQNFLVDRRFQFFYATKVMLMCFFLALNLGLFSFSFIKASLDMMPPDIPMPSIWSYAFSFVLISFTFSLTAFILSFRFSHRMAGPIYALERYVDELTEGYDRPFKLRDKDHHRSIERIAKKIRTLKRKGRDER